MHPESERERRALADRLERLIGVAPGHGQSLGPREVPLVIAALRATPDDREARVRAAEAMRERAADLAVEISSPTDCWYVGDQIAAAIRALSIPEAAPEGDGRRTMESAPRDGTEIILTDGVNVGTGFYGDAAESRRAGVGPGFFDECDRGNLLTARGTHATRWRPLPPPPSTLSTGPGGGDV